MIEINAKNFVMSKASRFLFTKFAMSFNTSLKSFPILQVVLSGRHHATLSNQISLLFSAAGDLKMFKELSAVRSAVLQREQTEKFYKRDFFSSLQNLTTCSDPLSSFALQHGNEGQLLYKTLYSAYSIIVHLSVTLSSAGVLLSVPSNK